MIAPFAYAYDAVANRTSRTTDSSTDIYAYSSSSNRISSITLWSEPVRNFVFDAIGCTTNDPSTRRTIRSTRSASESGRPTASGTRSSTATRAASWSPSPGLTGALERELIYLGDIPAGALR